MSRDQFIQLIRDACHPNAPIGFRNSVATMAADIYDPLLAHNDSAQVRAAMKVVTLRAEEMFKLAEALEQKLKKVEAQS